MGKKTKRRQKKQLRQRKVQQVNSLSPCNQEKVSKETLSEKKIRVGYLSAEICNTPEADFLPAFFAAYDKNLFSVVGFNLNPPDEVTNIFIRGTDSWDNLSGMTSSQAAEAIKQHDLDFLVDISLTPSPLLTEIMERKPAKCMRKISSWCYTPFDKNKEFCVTTPELFEGFVTFGVLGSLFDSPEILSQVIELLLLVPESRLLLAAEDVLVCQTEAIHQEFRELGVSSRIILAEGANYPYEKVDIFLGAKGMRAYHLCRAYNRSIPVIIYADYADQEVFVTEVMKKAGCANEYAKTPAEYSEKALALATDNERLRRLHRRLYAQFQASAVMDLDQYILSLEFDYLRIYAAGKKTDIQEFILRANHAQAQKAWTKVVAVLSPLAATEDTLLPDHYLTLAWAYFFLKDSIRALYWAKKAERSTKPITALYLQAEILVKASQYEEAWQVIDRAFALAQRGENMLPEIQDALLIDKAAIAYRTGRSDAAALYWQVYQKCHNFYDRCMGYSSWLLAYNRLSVDRQDLFTKHLGYNDLFKDVKRFTHDKRKHRHQKLRIGYISPDFRAHVMSHFLWPFLATYDHDAFEVYVYSIGKEDQYTRTFKTLVDKWQNLQGIVYEQIAATIYADAIDILFDLAGHTSNSGLPVLAYKPAPIQISGLGYMTTTGLQEVDYFLTDGYVDPPGLNEKYFVEELLRLTTQFCYTGEDNWPESIEAPCRKRGWVLFGVFNHFGKITDEILQAWKTILMRVPKSQLLIKGQVLGDHLTVERIYAEWENKGMPMDRIIFEPSSSDYMLRYLDVDIALDTYPYPGGGTTCDALYMGVPVISCYGERHSSRFGYSILCNIGLSELAAASIDEYIEKAVALANDGELLDMFHQKLRQFMKKSPLMDSVGYIQEVEAYYKEIWQNWFEK